MTLVSLVLEVFSSSDVRVKDAKTDSQKCQAGAQTLRDPPREIMSDSVLLWEHVVRLLHIHEIGTNEPKAHYTPPEVALESCQSLVKESS